MQHNIAVNAALYPGCPPQAIVLDWEVDELPGEVLEMGAIDLIMYGIPFPFCSFYSLTRSAVPPISHTTPHHFLLLSKRSDGYFY